MRTQKTRTRPRTVWFYVREVFSGALCSLLTLSYTENWGNKEILTMPPDPSYFGPEQGISHFHF